MTTEMTDILQAHISKMGPLVINGQPIVPYSFIARHGRLFIAVNKVEDCELMVAKQCYSNSYTQQALGLGYVEGYGMIEGLIPLAHAWNVDELDAVLDYTWGSHRRAAYFGVEFSIEFVDDFVERTGYCGIFEGLYALKMSPEKVVEYLESGLV
jgi:hypothetical protein